METFEPHLAVGTALAVGLLIGMEREQGRPGHQGRLFAGVRTYPIFGVIGAVATLLTGVSPWFPLVALLGVCALVAVSYASEVRRHEEHGSTTEASVIATFLLGALATSRGIVEPIQTRLVLVVAIGVAITFLLSSKERLHGFASRVSKDDFYATVKFLIVAAIVLPLLPRRDMGPLDAINPFDVGLMIVMISALSFVGYVAVRLLGASRGLLLSAAAGGLVSSTAVTVAFSRRAKRDPALAPVAAGAVGIASTIMVIRTALLVGVIAPELLRTLALPLAFMGVGAAAGALVTYRKTEAGGGEPSTLENPFELQTAVRFGLVFAAVLLATRAAKVYLGDRGLYLASALGGTTDVDAVSLSTARLAGTVVTPHVAAIAILIAIAVNTIVKSTIALVIGGAPLGKRAAVIGGLIVAGGAAGMLAFL